MSAVMRDQGVVHGVSTPAPRRLRRRFVVAGLVGVLGAVVLVISNAPQSAQSERQTAARATAGSSTARVGQGEVSTSTGSPASDGRQKSIARCKLAALRFIRDRNVAKSKAEFLALSKEDPSFPMPYLYLGTLAEAEGDVSEAVSHYEKYVSLDQVSDHHLFADFYGSIIRTRSIWLNRDGCGQRVAGG